MTKPIIELLREARTTLEMWKDVAPAVSLCADIDVAIAEHSLSAQDEVLTDSMQANPHAATFPSEIWLQAGDDEYETAPYGELSEVSWCQDHIGNMDVRYVRADLAAAAPSPAVAVEPEPKRQVFLDEIDAAKAGSEWLEPFFGPGFRLCFSVDEGAQAPKAKWCMLFDGLDRVVAGYMLTRDAKNWTELTKINAATPSPSLAVRDGVEVRQQDVLDAARYRWLRDKARSVDWAWNLDANSYRTACRNNAAQMDLSIDTAMKD